MPGEKLTKLLFLFLFLNNCSSDDPVGNKNEIPKIDLGVALKNPVKNIPLSQIADKIDYIKLETCEECLIDRVEKLLIHGNHLFIAQREKLFLFDVDGKFVRSIGSNGKGPGEYLRVRDFTIHPTADQLSIYDSEQFKIIHYDLDGNFIREFKIDDYPSLIAYSPEGDLYASWVLPMYFYNDSYNINIYDSQGEITRQLMKRTEDGITEKTVGHIPSTSRTRFEYFNDTLSYWEVNYPAICRVVDGKTIPRYEIIKNFKPGDEEYFDGQIQEKKFYASDLVETSRFIIMTKGLYQNNVYHVLYDKDQKKANAFYIGHQDMRTRLNSGFINDIDGGYPFLPSGVIAKDVLYGIFYAYDMKNKWADEFFSQVEVKDEKGRQELLQLLEGATDTDNPIVMLVKMKSL